MRRSPFLLLVLVGLVAGCSSTGTEGGSSTGTDGGSPTSSPIDTRGGVPAGYPTDVDEFSLLVITALAPDPIPVTGTDGKVHVVYELKVLNYSPRDATLTRLETLDGGPDGESVAELEGDALAERTLVVPDFVPGPSPTIPVGRTALILVDDVYDTVDDVPASFTHRVDATFAPATPENEPAAAIFPGDPVSLIGGPVTTGTGSPVVIGPPVAGADWWAFNACCSYSPHRAAMVPVGARINGGERFAVDWFKADMTLDAVAQAASLAEGVPPTFRGDPTTNESYLAYGEPLLAVADGTIVKVRSDMPDSEPNILPTGLSIDEFGGNVVVIDIGDGVFASYAHFVPGSPTVEVGDKVTRGQEIGLLGNSGNSTQAHLHFQLQRTSALLSGDNVPFEIDTLTVAGSIALETGFSPDPDAGARSNKLPLISSVVNFPDAPIDTES